ncbi:hypothetical protein PSET11_01323 [Arthrobacter ulcerisalmonis]|uniref:Uncharacterized protein n=1 Tax=Arthrobacter ulcerisalmonis TaxID=2483813 RepID=A0A3P5WXW2_9MICC|nr:hypothetical protein [Arthrobacter ulcerisalmonis]VDC23881.1 hypothetical protein PSET11_01323 [Arthrobacter ulcerisalmonis]
MLAFHLTYAATVGVAFLMLLGQFLAFIVLLALAAGARLLVGAGLTLIRRMHSTENLGS